MGWELRESTSLQPGTGAALETAAAPTLIGKHRPVTFSAFFGTCSANALNNLAVLHPVAVPQPPTHTWAPPGTAAPILGAAPIAIRCAKPAGAERRIRDGAGPGRAMSAASQPRAPIAARPGPDAAGVNGSRERHPRAQLAHPSPALSAPLRLSESR